MKEVITQIEMVAQSDCTVLILGETGTGKRLVARAIHNLSQRKGHRMVKMNCAAIPATLIESDLFGHEKGAFTGATSTPYWPFERAEGGSLFLDEVGDMPLELLKLLRVLQEQEIERLGSSRVIPVNVRLIAGANQDLHQKSLDQEIPRRSLLSPERVPDPDPTAARAAGGYPITGEAFHPKNRPPHEPQYRQHFCRRDAIAQPANRGRATCANWKM